MDSRVIEIRKHLKKKLDPMRFEHTLGVSYTCQALAMRYGYDLDKAELAGLLHDCAKRYDRPTMLEKCISRGIPVSESEERDPSLLHAKLGAWMAREKYGVDDEEILSAIPQEKQIWGCWIRSFMWQIILSPGVIKLRICPG